MPYVCRRGVLSGASPCGPCWSAKATTEARPEGEAVMFSCSSERRARRRSSWSSRIWVHVWCRLPITCEMASIFSSASRSCSCRWECSACSDCPSCAAVGSTCTPMFPDLVFARRAGSSWVRPSPLASLPPLSAEARGLGARPTACSGLVGLRVAATSSFPAGSVLLRCSRDWDRALACLHCLRNSSRPMQRMRLRVASFS
mmetsp:Transcript_17816/g.50162  ORF Transcript_17816/g.50162 Transcript_17816/m.50162 type:complete len:201 (-) Transcript_17816:178-780(-)